ncbi:MAG TPA: rhodanese-like domain-containing protein [Pirellulaceae bacterium]|jgi:rhodanese-related sulfurtransferase
MLLLDIDVQTVRKLLDDKEPFLFLDCREASEVATAKIIGTTHIPMREIPGRLTELQPHQNGRVIVHCHHGGRSLRVTQFLRQQGFDKAQNMAGGIDAWSLEIDPTVPRYE